MRPSARLPRPLLAKKGRNSGRIACRPNRQPGCAGCRRAAVAWTGRVGAVCRVGAPRRAARPPGVADAGRRATVTQFLLELLVVLGALAVGARVGGIGLGVW